MYVDKSTEYYLIHSMARTKKQIKDMLPSEIKEHNHKIIRQRIEEQNRINGLKNNNSRFIY
jgi:hypothetical protein